MLRRVPVLLALCLAVAACGSGHARKPPVSVQTFRARADRICTEAHTHVDRLARLRALRPPEAEKDLYAHWLKAESDAVAAAKPPADPAANPLFDPKIGVVAAEGKIAGYARRLGATACR